MKKYFVISDIHGHYSQMIKALEDSGFDINNEEHIIINCGDPIDRGDESKEVLTFLVNLYEKDRAILIKGNHEDLLEAAIRRGYLLSHDEHNGVPETITQLTGISNPAMALLEMPKNDLWYKYTEACIDYYELGDYIFVHGWIPTNKVLRQPAEEEQHISELYWPTKDVYDPNWRTANWEIDWKEARWTNGMQAWREGIREPGKTIVCGHWHTSWGHYRLHGDGVEWLNPIETYYINPETGKQEPYANFGIFYDDGIIALDGCVAHTKQVNVLVINEKDL